MILTTHNAREKDPFEVIFSAVFAVSGVAQLIQGPTPGAAAELLPGWFRVLWLVMLIAGSLAILFGVYYRDPVTSMFTESVGLLAVALSLLVYGSGIIWVSWDGGPGAGSVMAGPMTLVLASAFYWKRRQILRATRELPKR